MSRTPREIADPDPIALARLLDRAGDLATALTAQAT